VYVPANALLERITPVVPPGKNTSLADKPIADKVASTASS
jgi:hypothetical protein